MTQRRHITLVAAGATMIAALPLSSVFAKWTWLVGSLIVVGMMTAAAVALRSIRSPIWLPTLGMIGTYVISLTWLFSDGNALLGIIPLPETFVHFNKLLADAGVTIRDSGVPIEDNDGLLFLAGLGIGAVYLAVDLAAVIARRPAIAGIPMVAVYLVPVGTHTKSVSFLAFVCTAAAFLWLLATDNVDRVRRFGRRFTGDGRDIDVWEPSPLAAAGRRLALIGVVVAVVLPLAIPGMSSGLLDRFGTGVGEGGAGPGNGPGRAGNVNLFSFLSGSLVRESSYDMVKVSTDDPSPFYLRFGVAEDLTSQGFVNRSWGQSTPLNQLKAPAKLTAPGVSYKTNAAVIEVLEFNERVLPLYEQVTKVDRLDGAWGFDQRSGVIFSGRNTAKGRKYTVHYTRPEFTPDALRTARDLTPEDQIRNNNIRKPENGAIKSIAEKLVVGKTNQYDRVRAVYDFFAPTNGFKYSLETKPGNSGSAMVDFLQEGNRQGYCEQYAAGMAWLLRAVDIPARVAFGFTKGNNRSGNTYTLSNFNLHAWTEVYFDGFGWIPFDATPPSGISGAVSSAWAPDPNQPTGSSGSTPNDDLVPGQDVSGGASVAPTNPYGPNDPGITGAAPTAESRSMWPWYLLGGVLVLLLLLVMPALRRVAVRRKRLTAQGAKAGKVNDSPTNQAEVAAALSTTDPEAGPAKNPTPAGLGQAKRDAHAAWDELLDTMVDYRVEIDPAETPRLTGERLITEARLPEAATAGVQVLSRAEERARYARSPLTDVDLGAPLNDVRTALREGVSLKTRLLATLLPPSVLARWRLKSSTTYLSLTTSVARRREALFRAVSPRRLLTKGR